MVAALKDHIEMLIPMFVCSFQKAVDIERAYMVKGFSFNRKRSFYRGVAFGRHDLIVFCLSLLLSAAVVFYG